jgi:hypothetical protein
VSPALEGLIDENTPEPGYLHAFDPDNPLFVPRYMARELRACEWGRRRLDEGSIVVYPDIPRALLAKEQSNV